MAKGHNGPGALRTLVLEPVAADPVAEGAAEGGSVRVDLLGAEPEPARIQRDRAGELAVAVPEPGRLEEAAAVDGASRWQRFTFIFIVMPQLKGVNTVVFAVTVIDSWPRSDFRTHPVSPRPRGRERRWGPDGGRRSRAGSPACDGSAVGTAW